MQNIINHNPLHYNSLDDSERKFRLRFPDINSAERNHYENMVSRTMSKYLTSSQYKVMDRIIAQSVKNNKSGAFITLDWLSEAINISLQTIRKIVNFLSDIGMIFTYRNQKHRFIVVNMAFTDVGYQTNPKYKKTKAEWKAIHKRLGTVIYKNLKHVIHALRDITPYWDKTMLRDKSRRKSVLRKSNKKGNTAAKPRERFKSVDDVIDNTPTEMKKKKPKKLVSPDGYATEQYLETLKDKQAKYTKSKSNAKASDSLYELEKYWRKGIKDKNGDSYPIDNWGGKQIGGAKNARNRIQDLSPTEKQQFFYDAGYNWQEMTDKYFYYQTININDGPDIMKLDSRVNALLNEFRSRDVIRMIERLPDKVQQPTMAEKAKTKEQENNDYFELMINNIGSLDRQTREFSRLSIQQKKRLNSAYNQFINPVPDHMDVERSLEVKIDSEEEKQANLERGIALGVLYPDGTYVKQSMRDSFGQGIYGEN